MSCFGTEVQQETDFDVASTQVVEELLAVSLNEIL
jgi:hypothetical protein